MPQPPTHANAHSLHATYLGDVFYLTSISSNVALTVNKAASAISLTSNVNPSVWGDSPVEITGLGGGPIEVASIDMHAQIMAGLEEFASKIDRHDDADIVDAEIVDEPAELEAGEPTEGE